MQPHHLSRLMYLSWEIQRKRHNNRSKALTAAWAIINNADITIHYLVRKHGTNRTVPQNDNRKLSLFHS
ncbi:hypothetical protein [Paraflavitalea pollutisoli]|uniref:hypothetical protein n=1 Tax=Paraflavitalea pollutisoli TaxID=3034143 RepID=UPI0023ECA327|nr:hypothetical protein [Paraflavitalea sp. H1-2-19X]